MLFLGHIAVSLILADATKSDRRAAIAGNLLPDVIDKTGGWVLRLMPSGRWLAHGLPFFGATILLARRFLDGPRWRGFALGYLGHLIGDLYGGASVPWLAPFAAPRKAKRGKLISGADVWPEVRGALAILALLGRRRPRGP